jgi:molybdopterin-guanine dinucleotide biosynthesis protein A
MQLSRPVTLGIVLVGGGSTRLAAVAAATGGGKALLTFRGKTFLEHVLLAVGAEVERTVVVASPGQTLLPLDGVRVVHDSTPGAGPLAGIRDGLRAALDADAGGGRPPRLAFVTSCDLPYLRPEVVRLLLDVAAESDALWTVPIVHGHRQVMVSVIRVELLQAIDAWLATGRRDLRGLLAEIARNDPRSIREVMEEECKAVDPTLGSFVDIDTLDDFQRLQTR